MTKEFPSIPWARYADDGIAHCVSLKQAKYLQRRLQKRFEIFGLELNMEKTRIVYYKDDDQRGNHEYVSFDFLEYIFRPRHAKNKYGKYFTNFLPAMGEKAKKAIRKYKNRNSRKRAEYWLGEIAKRDRNLFAHWKFGILPSAG